MAEDGRVIYKVEADTGQFESDIRRAGQKAGDTILDSGRRSGGAFEEIMTGAARRIGEAFVNMAAQAVYGVGQIMQAGVEFNAKMETYQTAFTTLLGDSKEAARVMEQIREDAAATPFDVDSLTQANQLLISAGVSADQARTDVLSLANAIAATGGGSDELARMASNMQQIQNVGKATAVDIKQFAIAGINIYGLLADSMGVTAAEAAEMDVTYEQLAAALEHAAAAGGMYENALETQSQTFTGKISTLKDNVTMLTGVLTEDLFNTLSEVGLPSVIEWVDTLLTAAEMGGVEGALQAGREILLSLINTFIDNLPEIASAGVELVIALIEGLTSDGALQQLIARTPEIIHALVSAIINNLPELAWAGFQLIFALIQGLLQAAVELPGVIWDLILQLANIFETTDWKTVGRNIITGIGNGLLSGWQWLVDTVSNIVNSLWTTAKKNLGIHSPSRKFAFLGEMTDEGFVEGLEDGEQHILRTVTTLYGGAIGAAQDAIAFAPYTTAYNGINNQDIERNITHVLTATGTAPNTEIIVPLYLDGREVARATAWQMGEQLAWEEM